MNREKFPLLKNIVYLDSASTMLKPKEVVTAIANFYLEYPMNPHSTESQLGVNLQAKIKKTREVIANLIFASSNEIIFTSGTTDSLNKAAQMFKNCIEEGDEILLSEYNHLSNVIPWIEIAKEKKAHIILSKNIYKDINDKTKIVAYAQINNTIFQYIDIEKLYRKVKKHKAFLINDAAQAISHNQVSLCQADVIVFSANKLYGPTGIGVLAIKKELLNSFEPTTFGGGIVTSMNQMDWKPKDGIEKFEAGTPNTAGIIGFLAAINFFNSLENVQKYEKDLANYVFEKLKNIEGIKFYSQKGDINILFNIKNYNAQDIVSSLGHKNIILRSGNHCVQTLSKEICKVSTIRCSIASYNNKKDIDIMVKAIQTGGDFIDFI